jgi:hypothetical protein
VLSYSLTVQTFSIGMPVNLHTALEIGPNGFIYWQMICSENSESGETKRNISGVYCSLLLCQWCILQVLLLYWQYWLRWDPNA